MVKHLRYIVVVLVTMFMFNTNVLAASSKFDPTINLEPDIVNNQITLILGFQGEEVMATSHKVSWDSRYLTFVDIIPLEGFNVTKSNIIEDAEYRTLNILADSDYSFLDTNYAVIIFSISDEFKVGTKTDLIWYEYESAGVEVYKYRHKGYIMTLNRESRDKMVYLEAPIDDSTKIDYWFRENWLLVAVGVLALVAVLVIIMVWPTKRKKEKREQNVRKQTKDRTFKFEKQDYKIDHEKLDKIAGINRQKDMSEAIIISDLNPFESAVGSQRTVAGQEHTIDGANNNLGSVNVNNNAGVKFIDPGMVNSNPENLAQVYIPDQNLAPGQSQVAPVQPVQVNLQQPQTEAQQIDAFNMKIGEDVQPQVAQVQTPQVQSGAPAQPIKSDLFEEIKDDSVDDNLVLFQPQNFESAHKSNNDIETLVFALLFILASLFISVPVKALNFEIDELRECIVGNIPEDEKFDYNEDGLIDVVDLIKTKDLDYATMEDVGEDHPGHFSIEDQGYTTTVRGNHNKPNFKDLIFGTTTTKSRTTTTTTTTTHPGFVDVGSTTTSTTGYVSGDNDTTTTVTTTASTTKGDNSTTTTKKTTTKFVGTVTTKKTTTKAKTTTKKTTKKTTTTTTTTKSTRPTTKLTYKVNFRAVNGTVEKSSVTVDPNGNIKVKSSPNEGHSYSSIYCSNSQHVIFNTTTNTIEVSGVSANSSCSIKYVVNEYKIKFEMDQNGSITNKSKTVEHGSKLSYSYAPEYYNFESISCLNHSASYSSGKIVIDKVTGNDTCSVRFTPYKFKVNITAGTTTTTINTNYTPAAAKQTFVAKGSYSTMTCATSEGNKSIRLTKGSEVSSGMFEYTFNYQVKFNMDCTAK